jgi:hypothetical protein
MKTIRARVRILQYAVVFGTACFVLGGMIFGTSSVTYATQEVPIDTTPQKIDALKADLVSRLMACESAGHTEGDGIIIFDSNAKASIGRAQFQKATIVYYEKQLYDRDVSGKEAVEIALDDAQAAQLAQDIIFKTDDGLHNWVNCGNKLQLAPEVAVIEKLER